jgi:hypothetical protein
VLKIIKHGKKVTRTNLILTFVQNEMGHYYQLQRISEKGENRYKIHERSSKNQNPNFKVVFSFKLLIIAKHCAAVENQRFFYGQRPQKNLIEYIYDRYKQQIKR